MYRIELSPGEETVFRSIEELAVAIKRGVVTPRARIYHNASSKWLPIQFHPHYKVAVSMPLTQAALVAGPPVKPLSALRLQEPDEPEPPVPTPAPMPVIKATPPMPVAKLTPATVTPEIAAPTRRRASRSEPATERPKRARRGGKSHRQLRIALVGALLVGGAQWVLSAPLFSRAETTELLKSHRRLIVAPANSAAMVPVINPPDPSAATPASTTPASFGGAAVTAPATTPVAKPETPLPSVETAEADIEPAPASIDVAAPAAARADSLAPKVVDSSNQKAMKGILRAVSGTTVKEKPQPRR